MLSKVDIVIVNWNSGALLEACLRSIAAADISSISQVIVVDNGSIDGSADVHFAELPLVVVKTGKNLGFGKACNLGAEHGRAEYILFLNPDTEVFGTTVSEALKSFNGPEMQRVGVVGIKMVNRVGQTQVQCARFPSWSTFVSESSGLAHLFPRFFRSTIMAEFDHETTRDVDHVIGAFYLVRRHTFEQVGRFDERFFVYFEDLDLSRRINDQGWRIRYLSEPVIYHRQGGTSEQIKARRLTYVLEGRFIYAQKHFDLFGRIGAQLAMLFIEPFTRTALGVLRRSPGDVAAVWFGHMLFTISLIFPAFKNSRWR